MSRFVELGEGDNLDIDLSEIQAVVFPVEGEEVTIEPTTEEQVILPTSDRKLIGKATVKAVTSEIDENIKPENIVLGKTILGVQGNVAPDKPDQTKTTIPTKERQVVRADVGYELAESIIEPIPDEYINPQGEIELVENRTYNVREFETAKVNVPMPSGEILIDENNKTYDVKDYETARVEVVEKPKGEYCVQVFDFYGNLIDEKWLDNGEVYDLPNPPSDNRLDFQEWSSSQEIVNNQVIIDDYDVMIGAIGTPKSGLCEFDYEVTKESGKSITLNMDGTKNWGDGTSDNLTTHEYADYGKYVVTCNGTTLSAYVAGQNGEQVALVEVRLANLITGSISANNIFRNCSNLQIITFPPLPNAYTMGENMFYERNKTSVVIFPKNLRIIPAQTFYYSSSIQNIIIPYNCEILQDYSIYECQSLKKIVVPKTAQIRWYLAYKNQSLERMFLGNFQNQQTNNYAQNSCVLTKLKIVGSLTSFSGPGNAYKLNEAYFPDNIITFTGGYNDCYGMEEVVFPNNITTIKSGFIDCYSIKKIKMPNNLTTLNGGFSRCYALKILDFSGCLQIPSLTTTSIFQNITGYKIVVPDELYDSWIVATNWVNFANRIYKASEVQL